MLVLSRKEGQTVQVGDDVTITVTKILGNRVKIGFDAPDHVCVLRGEHAENNAWIDLMFGEEKIDGVHPWSDHADAPSDLVLDWP